MFKISEELAMQEGERISKELPKPDSEQMYNSFGVIDNNKCLLEGGEDLATGEQVSKELLKQEVEWMYNSIGVTDNKRPLEDREDSAARKTAKPLEINGKEETVKGLHDLSLVQTEQPVDQNHGDHHSESNLLIYQLGRDMSINCLAHCSRSDYGAIAALNKAFRSVVRSGELYRLRRLMGIAEHWVYFSCNLLEWEAFDPIRHKWMHLPRMTSNECFMCSDKESLAVGTELLVFGKEIISHVIYRYSILTNTWSSGMSMNQGRCLFGSASLGEIAILAGGCDSCGNILSSAELYDSLTGTWVTIPSMRKARKMCSAVFMDGKFYVVGGIGTETPNMLTCGEFYDLKTRSWTVIPNMCPPRNRQAAITTSAGSGAPPLIAVVKNELYAADYAQQELKKYDKRTNVWTTIGRLPERADSMNGWGLAFKACGDMLIVIGGPRNFGGGMIELNVWVPGEGPPVWNLLAAKPSASFVYNCAVMGC
ncbi:F-box/kelch-repeat protein At1g74510-like [Mangifera indica]|uniref:F-box/kelch-repeat protein At1g74510-like n=1 Tax=Mangifera indica TaxID=29780 RepID=UPI001CF995D3|nr:F-box/kelch-repeat protein At1g74510-like [Mangifera indica]XP_044484914.1 F-box/kelch-repeat protein At1g74510-like [Mangifera indica]XP_044484915.1 F-box/kelch-repeat protein At1g74510-like [Mangifera indica]XP_044484916.1 F-box/kelch-repeat protein At1g74510-like [Mangifera indica]XP_044484917.1 F-box/kelch-repeat protein At1g74510-like [Mangifera indica]XP_044484918.1 F-box/kelch-repeat protein At1g74510-like [Mangifera indica]